MTDLLEPRYIIKTVLKWWWVLIAATILGAGAGFGVSQRLTTKYQASTTMAIDRPAQTIDLARWDIETGERLTQIYADLALRQPILQSTIGALNLNMPWQSLKEIVRTEINPEIQLFEVFVTHQSPEQAQRIANEIAQQLILTWQTDESPLFSDNNAEPATNSPVISVIEPAQINHSATRPQIPLNTVISGLLGFVVALGAIFLYEIWDDSIKSVDDFDRFPQLAKLGGVGKLDENHPQSKLIASLIPASPMIEAYRVIRSNIQFRQTDQPLTSLMVTSPEPNEGKSISVANLGLSMAQAGLNTIIVDADLRYPSLHKVFDVPYELGLTELLSDENLDSADLLKDTPLSNLKLLTSGTLPFNPSELLSSPQLVQVIKTLESQADIVIYDSSSALLSADATILAHRVTQVILVAKAKSTKRAAIQRTIESFDQVGANMLGGMLNQIPNKELAYTDYYYFEPEYQTITPSQSDELDKAATGKRITSLQTGT